MQLSIGKLATALIALLITTTLVTTAAGLLLLKSGYRSFEERQYAEAQDTARNIAITIGNQVRFYQGIVQMIAANPDLSNLLEFGDAGEITKWAAALGRLVPGTLGTAVASGDGVVFGDPLTQRVGPACQDDMRRFAAGEDIDYPLLHIDSPGFEHFDLLLEVKAPSGDKIGTLFVSFRLDVVDRLLTEMTRQGDRVELFDHAARRVLVSGSGPREKDATAFREPIPYTGWSLTLHRGIEHGSPLVNNLIVVDALVITGFAFVVIALVRRILSGFASDMSRVHQALSDVLSGCHEPSAEPTAIKEIGTLLPGIEQLALQIQRQRDDLRLQSLSDPLTGVFNRRYFDLMLNHLHEQSRRGRRAVLVLIDLDDFKRINDEYGHARGDLVLQRTAFFLRGQVRTSDIVARLGGDEFALILTNLEDVRIEEWLDELLAEYEQRVLRDAANIPPCLLSIGVAEVDARHYATACDVFEAADLAMYGIKEQRLRERSRYALAEVPQTRTVEEAR